MNPKDDYVNSGDGVGHTFISIQQGDKIRSFGFYPSLGVGYFAAFEGEMGNDSNHNYTVSISIHDISAHFSLSTTATLPNIINKSEDYAEKSYTLQGNNCTDFGIAVSNWLGLNIPKAQCQGNWGVGSGSTPGKFGDYMRHMTLPQGVTRDTIGGVAPANSD